MTGTLVLVLAVALVGGGYAVACRWWPYAACRRCHGDGKLRSPSGKAWRTCRRCKGTGSRLRTGRKILNRFSGTAARAIR